MTRLCPIDPSAILIYMPSWLNLWMSMSAPRIFQGIYGIRMTCSPNGLRTASVRKLTCFHNSYSCPRLWHPFAHGHLFYKLLHGQLFSPGSWRLCGRLYLCLKAALQKARSEQAASSQSKRTQINFTTASRAPLPHPTHDKVASRHSSRFHPYSRPR